MKIIQRRDVILGARNRWLRQYDHKPDEQIAGWVDRTFGDIRAALAKLDIETCSAADIDAALGTRGWAANKCDQCGDDLAVLVHIGQEPEYEARWQALCGNCLSGAMGLLSATVAKP